MVQQLTKAIPERLHFTAKNKNRNHRGAKYDTIEIVPKSTISRQDNENPSSNSLVESHANSNNNHNENTESNITTENYNRNALQRNNHTEEEEYKEEEPIPLGSAKFQERFAIKRRKRKRIREEEQALQQETNNNGRNNIDETTGSINNHNHREDEVRQPSALPELILLHWSDLDDDDDVHDGKNKLVPNPSDETVCHTLQGALKNVGLFHEKIQSIIDLDEDLHDDNDSSRNMLAACSGKDRKKFRKERLGKLDNAASVGGNISDNISCSKKRGQSASSRVLRVMRKGEEWMEIDLGECLLQFDMATMEADASSNSNRSDISSTSTLGGRQRNPSYKLYAFRSLEISASLRN
jgi:hypothetical protein